MKNTLMFPKVHMESLDKEPEYRVALACAAGRDSLANAIRGRLELYGRRDRKRH